MIWKAMIEGGEIVFFNILYSKTKRIHWIIPYTFNLFIKRYGEKQLLDCLERNEKNGVVYHREGINGDYDDFNDIEELISFIQTGNR